MSNQNNKEITVKIGFKLFEPEQKKTFKDISSYLEFCRCNSGKIRSINGNRILQDVIISHFDAMYYYEHPMTWD